MVAVGRLHHGAQPSKPIRLRGQQGALLRGHGIGAGLQAGCKCNFCVVSALPPCRQWVGACGQKSPNGAKMALNGGGADGVIVIRMDIRPRRQQQA